MPSSFTFRCPECRKLLAASRSRIGTMVICPKCQCDLLVPTPTDGATASSSAGANTPIESSSGPVQVGSSTAYRDPGAAAGVGGSPIFLPIQIEDDPLSLRPETGPRSHKIPDRSTAREVTPAPPPVPRADRSERSGGEPTQQSAAPHTDARVQIQPGSAIRDSAPRRSDVVLPRTAVVLWSFVVLVALVMAFVAGLLAGHFLWSVPPV